MKPCGWGVPYSVDDVLRIPGDVVLETVRGYRIFVDGRLLHEYSGRRLGDIVDKEAFIRYLLEGVDVVHVGVSPGRLSEYSLVVDARGHAAYPGRKALALQATVRVEPPREEIWVYFYSDLVGYGWVFPAGDRAAHVGVGGLAGKEFLERRLAELLRTVSGEVVRVSGSPIASGGLKPGKGRLAVGEALGAVMPLTGEGIRPGLISARAVYESIAKGKPLEEHLKTSGLALNVELQLRILSLLEKSTPEERVRIFSSAPLELLERVTAGNVEPRELLGFSLRYPAFFARLGLKAVARG